MSFMDLFVTNGTKRTFPLGQGDMKPKNSFIVIDHISVEGFISCDFRGHCVLSGERVVLLTPAA